MSVEKAMANAAQIPEKTPAQKLEGIAFTFCKCATVALICGRFALPIAATLCAVFYILAYFKGEKETRCILGPPLMVSCFWVLVTGGWVWWNYFSPFHGSR